MSRVKVSNEYWVVGKESDRQISMFIAKELDKLQRILTEIRKDKDIQNRVLIQRKIDKLKEAIDDFGDYLLDTDIRYAEVAEQ